MISTLSRSTITRKGADWCDLAMKGRRGANPTTIAEAKSIVKGAQSAEVLGHTELAEAKRHKLKLLSTVHVSALSIDLAPFTAVS